MGVEAATIYSIAILIFAVTPGPGVFAILARALTQGVAVCTPLAFGMVLGDLVYLMLAIMGLGYLAQTYDWVFGAIQWFGVIYLGYLAITMWRLPAVVQEENDDEPEGLIANKRFHSHRASLMQGWLIALSNPKTILFYLAFLPTFMDLTRLTSMDAVLVSVLTVIGLMIGLMAIALGAGKAASAIRTESGIRWINRTAGTVMGLAAVALALQ